MRTCMAIAEREIDAWTTWLRASGRSGETIGLRTYHIRRVMGDLETDPWALSTEQLLEYLAAQDWKPETRRSYRASLRSFYAWAQATGRRTDSPAALLPSIRVPRKVPRPAPTDIYKAALLAADVRVRLMLELAAICGLRRGEIARLRREHVHTDLVGHSLIFAGKGGHERIVPLPDFLARDLLERPAGWIFPSVKTAGPLTPAHVGKLVSRVLPEGWTCHTLRHRCATVAYWGSKDIRAVQELLGHAKLDTTMLYTLVNPEQVRELIRLTSAA